MPDSFGKRMFARMGDAYEKAKEADQVVKTAVPILQQAVAGNKQQIEALSAVLAAMQGYQELFGAATGHLSELETFGLQHELAHLTTFIQAMDIYFASEPVTVQSALDKFDLSVLGEALEKVSKERFSELFETMEKAKTRRYKKAKEAKSSE